MRRFLVDLRLIVGTADIYRQFWPPNSALYMGIITHLGRRACRLRCLWRDVRRFVIPLWAVFDPVILRRCERLPRLATFSNLPHRVDFIGGRRREPQAPPS
jgi:hypothetical protein